MIDKCSYISLEKNAVIFYIFFKQLCMEDVELTPNLMRESEFCHRLQSY